MIIFSTAQAHHSEPEFRHLWRDIVPILAGWTYRGKRRTRDVSLALLTRPMPGDDLSSGFARGRWGQARVMGVYAGLGLLPLCPICRWTPGRRDKLLLLLRSPRGGQA